MGCEFPQPYHLLHGVKFDLPHLFTSTVSAGAEFPHRWDVQNVNPVEFSHLHRWDLSDPLRLITSDEAVLTHSGQLIPYSHVEFGVADDDLFWTGEVILGRVADYASISLGDSVTISFGGQSWVFIVDNKSLDRSVDAPRASLSIVSPASKYAPPWVTPITRAWDAAILASDAAQEAAGVAIQWDLVDWTIQPGRLAVYQANPLQVASMIAEAAGGILESLTDGTLRARPRFPVNVLDWSVATPSMIISTSGEVISIEERYEVDRRFNRVTISSEYAGDKFLSVFEDDRPDGLNAGRSENQPGDTTYLLAIAGPGVTVDVTETSDGTIFPAAAQEWEEDDLVTFDATGTAVLKRPIRNLINVTWIGRSLGALTLGIDRQTITAAQAGVAVARLRVSVSAFAFSLAIPTGYTEEVIIQFRATGSEGGEGTTVVCVRGDGDIPGEGVVEPLLSGLPSLLARGSAELNTGEPLRLVRLNLEPLTPVIPGQIIEVQDQTFTIWRGQVTSVHHRVTPDTTFTSLEVLRYG